MRRFFRASSRPKPSDRLVRHCVLTLAISAVAVMPADKTSGDWPTGAASTLAAAGQSGKPSITLEAIVERRDLAEISMSSDDRSVALLTVEGSLASNRYSYTVEVASSRSNSPPRQLLRQTARLWRVRWSPDGRWLSYLSDGEDFTQLWGIDTRTGTRRLITRERSISAYEWSPTGQSIGFTTTVPLSGHERDRLESAGVLYDDETMVYSDLLGRSWGRRPGELRILDRASGVDRLLWTSDDEMPELAWSPDGNWLAVGYSAAPVQQRSMVFFNQDIAIVSASDGSVRQVIAGEAHEGRLAWSPDGRALAFTSVLENATSSLKIVDASTGHQTEYGLGALGQRVAGLWWDARLPYLWFERAGFGLTPRAMSGLYRLDFRSGAVMLVSRGAGHLSACTLGASRRFAACINQAPSLPPQPAVVSLLSTDVRLLNSPDQRFKEMRLGAVRELHWRNRYGDETNGLLVYPLQYSPRRRYPTLVVLYGFDGKFLTDAEWITSYPVQAFSRDGFAVLLVNPPPHKAWSGRSYAQGTEAVGYSPMASIEAGVHLLTREHIADSARVGILGWSYGCFLAEFAIAHSQLFKAASVGGGGDYNPGIYWLLGRRTFRENYERVLGGPPYGATLKNWLAFSPAFNLANASAPVMMEFSATEALFGLEMSTALRRQDLPVDFWVYPDEGHVLMHPKHRYHSMERNLEWFRYWLQGWENPAPEKYGQYQRWRGMASALERRAAKKTQAAAKAVQLPARP
jgi:dipeptidyl aminopeptidase/acylaminoacyl peptidase